MSIRKNLTSAGNFLSKLKVPFSNFENECFTASVDFIFVEK